MPEQKNVRLVKCMRMEKKNRFVIFVIIHLMCLAYDYLQYGDTVQN